MKSIQVNVPGGPENLQLMDVPTPRPGPGQALVRIAASGVNFIDIYFHAELCAGAGTADMATHDPRATATGARTGALTEPGRVSAGGSADQAVERDQRFAGRQRAADSGGAQQRGNRCGEVGRVGRRPAEVHERAI